MHIFSEMHTRALLGCAVTLAIAAPVRAQTPPAPAPTNAPTGALTGATLKSGLLAAPAPGTFGNFPRNFINGPNFSQVDISLTKRTRIYEKANVEFKANFINAFNHTNLGLPGVTSVMARITPLSGLTAMIAVAGSVL